MLQYSKRPPLHSSISSDITDKVGGVWDKNEINVVCSRKLAYLELAACGQMQRVQCTIWLIREGDTEINFSDSQIGKAPGGV